MLSADVGKDAALGLPMQRDAFTPERTHPVTAGIARGCRRIWGSTGAQLRATEGVVRYERTGSSGVSDRVDVPVANPVADDQDVTRTDQIASGGVRS